MTRKKLSWEAAARRSILGEKHELQSLDGYWFRPRKYSVPGEEEIKLAAANLGAELPGSVIKKIAPLYKEKELGEITKEDFLAVLDDEEMELVMRVMFRSNNINTESLSLMLKYGIGLHNFEDPEKETDIVTDALIEALLEYPDTVAEMIPVIRDHNSPLSQATPETSKTQQNGFTAKQISASNAKISQTEETPSS